MAINFNFGKKNDAEDDNTEEIENVEESTETEAETENTEVENYEVETAEEDNSADKSTVLKMELKNKLIRFAIIGAILLVLLIIVLYLSSLVNKKPTTNDYAQVETVLEKAAIAYFKDYPGSLPKKENQVVKIEAATLVAAGKMKDLSSYTKKGVVCSGYVEVRKRDDEYIYTPYLDCGENYASKKLYEALTAKTVDKGYGLYKVGAEYVYRGENLNNYVQLENGVWRIVKITEDNNIVLVREGRTEFTYPWDNRYNVEEKYNIGINNYSTSRIKESLEALYKDDVTKEKTPILSSKDKAKMVAFDLCIGKRSVEEEKSVECSQKLEKVYIGMLTVSEYIKASVDGNCKSAATKSCQNYNYLSGGINYWLVTANSDSSSQAYSITDGGTIKNSYTSDYAMLRPVIHLNSNVMVYDGNGSKEDPYLLK